MQPVLCDADSDVMILYQENIGACLRRINVGYSIINILYYYLQANIHKKSGKSGAYKDNMAIDKYTSNESCWYRTQYALCSFERHALLIETGNTLGYFLSIFKFR